MKYLLSVGQTKRPIRIRDKRLTFLTSVQRPSYQMASGSQPRAVDNEISQFSGGYRATNPGPSLALAGIPRARGKRVVCRTSEGCQAREKLAAMEIKKKKRES